MGIAHDLVARLLEADSPESAKSFIKRAHQASLPKDVVRFWIGPRAPACIVDVPVTWFRVGSAADTAFAVISLRHSAPPPPRGVTPGQWLWMLEVVEYAMNEGEDFSGNEADEAEGRTTGLDSDYAPPSYRWEYRGGRAARNKSWEWAVSNAPFWRDRE